MILSKKQILLTFTLTLCSLGLMAGEVERKRSAAQIKISEATGVLNPIADLIGEYAQEDRLYREAGTLAYPGSLLGFSDNEDGIKLTSVGVTDDLKLLAVTHSMNTGQATKIVIDDADPNPGKILLSGDGKILMSNEQFFDTTTGEKMSNLLDQHGHPLGVYYKPIRLNHDGTMLALGAKRLKTDETWTTLLNVKTKKQTVLERLSPIITYGPTASNVKFSRDGTILAFQSNNQNILLFDTTTGTLKQVIDTHMGTQDHGIASLDLNNDGSFVVYSVYVSDHQEVVLMNLSTGKKQKITDTKVPIPFNPKKFLYHVISAGSHFEEPISAHFTNTSDNVYTRQYNDIKFLSGTGSLIQKLRLPLYKEPSNTALSPDDRFLAVGYPDHVEIFEGLTQAEIDQKEREQNKIKKEEETIRTKNANLSAYQDRLGNKRIEDRRKAMLYRSGMKARPNVFYQSYMKAGQKKSASVPIGSSSPYSSEPAVEDLD